MKIYFLVNPFGKKDYIVKIIIIFSFINKAKEINLFLFLPFFFKTE